MSKNVNYLEIYDMVVELPVRHSCSLIHLLGGGCFLSLLFVILEGKGLPRSLISDFIVYHNVTSC
jgi:hypothetical protein